MAKPPTMGIEAKRTLNLLLVTFSFPPVGAVGVLRALSFARYLPESGVRVDVLTARNAPAVGRDLALVEQVPASVTVHRTWTLDLPFALRKGVKRLVSGRTAHASAATAPAKSAAKGNPLKQIIGNLLLPDPQVGWLPFALSAAVRIVKARKIDAVLITVPPFSSVRLVTMLRKRFPDLPIVLDFRDEWLTTTINLVSFNQNERARAVAQKAEREAVRDATVVVAVTDAARRELQARYPSEKPQKFHWISNGFESRVKQQQTAATQVQSEEHVVLTYIGSVYGSTDPNTFIEAVLALPVNLRQRLRVRFIGHIETVAYRQSLQRLGETVKLQGFLPRAEALAALDNTDYLLLITHDRINVSAKFYDYLSGTKPIFAAVQPDGEVRRLLEETQAGYWANVKDPSAIGSLLRKVLRGGEDLVPLQPRADRIALYHRQVLASRYARLLEDLVHRSTVRADV